MSLHGVIAAGDGDAPAGRRILAPIELACREHPRERGGDGDSAEHQDERMWEADHEIQDLRISGFKDEFRIESAANPSTVNVQCRS